MLILGKTNDDKGKQLEQIAGAMLESKGYRNIRFNSTRAGGAEYDIKGELVVPMVGKGRDRRIKIVGECKARKDPTNMTDWQKFLGKVFLQELKKPQQVAGVFIAASGYNSPVASSFEEVVEHRDYIELIDEREIEEFLLEAYEVCPLQRVAANLARYTERTTTSIELGYYSRNCYWVVAFEKGVYTLFDSAGQPLSSEASSDVCQLIATATSFVNFVDLPQETAAIRRNEIVQRQVLARLMLKNGDLSFDELYADSPLSGPPSENGPPIRLSPPNPPFTQDELTRATLDLEERGWIIRREASIAFSNLGENGRCPNFVALLRFWFEGPIFLITLYEAVSSRFYDMHIDNVLLEEVLRIQGELPLTAEERTNVLRVLKISPTALQRALVPIELITNHRLDENQGVKGDAIVDNTDRNIFFQVLSAALVQDCRSQELAAYYSGMRGVWEVEQNERIIVKNGSGIDTQLEWRSRFSARPSNVQGGFLHFIVVDGSPEPWEEAERERQRTEQNAPLVREGDGVTELALND